MTTEEKINVLGEFVGYVAIPVGFGLILGTLIGSIASDYLLIKHIKDNSERIDSLEKSIKQ